MDDIRSIFSLATLLGMIWFGCLWFQIDYLDEAIPFDPERYAKVNRYLARFLTFGRSNERVLWGHGIVQVIATLVFVGALVAKYLFHNPDAFSYAVFWGAGGNFMISAAIKFVVTLYLRNRMKTPKD